MFCHALACMSAYLKLTHFITICIACYHLCRLTIVKYCGTERVHLDETTGSGVVGQIAKICFVSFSRPEVISFDPVSINDI